MVELIIILGAGPKGVALAAKHRAIADRTLPPYIIIERHGVGAHWTGLDGKYTDGDQRLVSPPEQDLGYPYKSQQRFATGHDINERVQAVSWLSYLTATERLVHWLNNGRQNPTHTEFVKYLEWASSRIPDFRIEITEVAKNKIGLTTDGSLWQLACENGNKFTGQGLVITGHGGPKRVDAKGYGNPRISDGRDFWQLIKERKLDQYLESGKNIGVVGSGETAGAIALEILKHAKSLKRDKGVDAIKLVLICSRYPGYFLRSDESKDLEYFSSAAGWDALNIPERRAVIRRADRGVVSGLVKYTLERSECVRYLIADEVGWAKDYDVPKDGPVVLELKYKNSDEEAEEKDKVQKLDCSFLVFAAGFDDLWFLKLFDEDLLLKFMSFVVGNANALALKKLQADGEEKIWKKTVKEAELPELLVTHFDSGDVKKWLNRRLEHLIHNDLTVRGFTPKLHLPRLAGLSQGPGFPNLNCLGLMSDRILSSYLPM